MKFVNHLYLFYLLFIIIFIQKQTFDKLIEIESNINLPVSI